MTDYIFMEIKAISKSVRISPRKVRLIADMIRHLSIDNALSTLKATQKRAAIPLAITLKSAIANAVNNARLDKNSLTIDSINITQGPSLKRFHPSTRGRIHPYKRKSSNINIILKTKEVKTNQAATETAKALTKNMQDKKIEKQKIVKKEGVKKN